MEPQKIPDFPKDLEKIIGNYRVNIIGAKGVVNSVSQYLIWGDVSIAKLGEEVKTRSRVPPFKKYKIRKFEWKVYASNVCLNGTATARALNLKLAEGQGVMLNVNELREIIEPVLESYSNTMHYVNNQ